MNENNDMTKQPEQPDTATRHPFLMRTGSGSLCGKSCGRQDKQLNTYDWLADIPGNANECELVEVQFKNTRKGYFRNSNRIPLEKGDIVAVEATPGHDIGTVTLTGRLVPLQIRKANLKPDTEFKRIYRKAKPTDMDKYKEAKAREHDTMIRSRQIAKELKLDMKIGDVEYQGDGNKAIFYYIAEGRVDFRQLIKVLAEVFRVRIEMKQIGARQEAGRIGGIGPCGRFRSYHCSPIPGHRTQPAETCRSMRQTEVLSQLRGRHLCRSPKKVTLQRDHFGNKRRHLLLLQDRHPEQSGDILHRQVRIGQRCNYQRPPCFPDYQYEQTRRKTGKSIGERFHHFTENICRLSRTRRIDSL